MNERKEREEMITQEKERKRKKKKMKEKILYEEEKVYKVEPIKNKNMFV